MILLPIILALLFTLVVSLLIRDYYIHKEPDYFDPRKEP